MPDGAPLVFELLTGQHPLPPARTAADAISVLLHAAPRLALLGAHPTLRPVVERLLARAPHERYADAEQALRALMQACNLPLPAESAEVRESFLHSADFVGRDAEWARLRAALDRVMSQGSGDAWLVAGESGVGKSRLVDELRTYALVQGALVVRGQSVSAGGSAYQAWQELLRPLCLYVPLTELERSVMASLVPDVGALQRCSVEPPPPLEPQAAQARLFAVAVSVLRRSPRPLLLILEDLHWAAPESMALLQRLLAALPDRPLLVLATYRDDEAPTLPAQLQAMHPLKLHRITAPEIARLTRSMLGPNGARPELVELLERETEGNEEIKYDDSHETSHISCG